MVLVNNVPTKLYEKLICFLEIKVIIQTSKFSIKVHIQKEALNALAS